MIAQHGSRAPAAPGSTAERNGLPTWELLSARLPELSAERRLLLRLRAPGLTLGAALVGFGLLLMYLSRHFGFFQDEYAFILTRRGWNADAFLLPHNGHLSVVPVAIYKLLFVTVGLYHTWPYRLILVALHLLCVTLLYLLAAPRAGRWLALVPALLLLLLGAGYEDLLWAFQIGFVGSLAAGLGALLCLERRSRGGDLMAGALLCVSLGSASVGLAMVVAVLAELVALRWPWRRLWVVVVPLILYGLWYLRFGTNQALLGNVPLLPSQDLETGAYGLAGLAALSQAYGQIMLCGSVAALIARVWRGGTLPARTIAGILGALAFWSLTVLARAQYGQPGASRYVYPSAVFILLAAVGLLQWRPLPPRAWVLIVLAIGAAGLSGLQPLLTYASDRAGVDMRVRDALGAAEVVGRAGPAGFVPDARHLSFLTLGGYLASVHQLGSPALTPRQIQARPEAERLLADEVILNAEAPPLRPPTAASLTGAAPIVVRRSTQLTVAPALLAGGSASCTRLTPTGADARAAFQVLPGQTLYFAMHGAGQVLIYARRLAAQTPARPLHDLQAAGTPALVPFPRDASRLPWHVLLAPTASLAVCVV